MNPKDKFQIFCEFVGNSLKKETNFPYSEYTEYLIKIYTKDKSWTIKKRYREFAKLQKKLSPLLANLPYFPEKKLFSTQEKIVNERILFLENYLNEVLKQVNSQVFNKLYEFLANFISLSNLKNINNAQLTNHEKNKINIMRTESTILESYSTNDRSDIETTVKFKTSRFEECLINKDIIKNFCPIIDSVKDNLTDFMTALSSEDGQITQYCKNFLTYITSNWTNFKFDDISLLYFGNLRHRGGLVYFAGRVNEDPFGAKACLDLLYSLLSFEINPDCEYYIHVFKYGQIDDLRLLNFKHYYEQGKLDSLKVCYNILRLWLVNNEKLKMTAFDILADEELVKLYNEFTSKQ